MRQCSHKPVTADKHRLFIARLAPDAITAVDIVRAVRNVHSRGDLRETAGRAYSLCSRSLRFAVVHGIAKGNPAANVALRDLCHQSRCATVLR